MREILFRGKSIVDGSWRYGDMFRLVGTTHIVCANSFYYAVIPETVGQYTGLTDKNGKKIFEGDILSNDWCFIYENGIVRFGEYKEVNMSSNYQCGHMGFYLEHPEDKIGLRKDLLYFSGKCEVIGNIHDNPGLIGGDGNG